MAGVVGKWNSVNVEKEVEEEAKGAAAAAVGLGILVHEVQNKYWSELSSTVVLKSCNLLKLSDHHSGKSSFSINDNVDFKDYSNQYYSTKSCCLCKNKLRADKDVYMYKGDQGFCSVECRNRLDHISDLEASTKKVLVSFINDGAIFQQDFRPSYSRLVL